MDTLCVSELVCKIDVFIQENQLSRRRKGPKGRLSLAQITAVCLVKSWFGIDCWKALFSNPLIQAGWQRIGGFELGSYGRFMIRMPQANPVMTAWLKYHQAPWDGLGAIDSTLVAMGKHWLGHDKHKYKKLRQQGVSKGYGSTGGCFGIKLHLATTSQGQIHRFALAPASQHDLEPVKNGFLDEAVGVVLADSGYVSHKEQNRLKAKSVALWARPAKHHQQTFSLVQARLYRFREVAESVFAKLKQSLGLVPKWPPRTLATCRTHILAALMVYTLQPNKPCMRWSYDVFRTT